ncbi:MAG: sulfatase [Deltaproteobacteria bacterium]|nr:sulfatase [Deltaproteobacteria bacterium]
MNENQNQKWSRRDFLIAGSTAAAATVIPFGCGGKEPEKKAAKVIDAAAKGTSWADTASILDFTDIIHLSDINHFGEFIDFGTAARFKYTLGGWMSGWENDSSMNGVSYTWASSSPSRLYFNLSEQMELNFEFRVKKGGTEYFSVYLNDHPLSRITMKGSDFDTYRINAPADTTVSGENYLKLIYSSADKEIAGKKASFAVDYLRIIPAGIKEPERFDPPGVAKLNQTYKTGKKNPKELQSIMMPVPSKLSFFVTIPKDAKFCAFGAPVKDAKGKIDPVDFRISAIDAKGGAPTNILSKSFKDSEWSEVVADLSKHENRLIRMDIEITGPDNSRFALGVPAIRVKPDAPAPEKKLKNVVVLLIDTLRADKLKSYGNRRVKSDELANFVEEATLFENCQSVSNWTKPACASVLTGLYPDTHKARGHSSKLSKSVKISSEIFREKGFNTAAFIANGYLAAEFGFNRGWTHYTNYIRENKNTKAENVFNDSLEFIKSSKDKPFFAYIQTIDPHVPYDPPEEDLKLYDARDYDGPVNPRSTGDLLEEYKRKKVELNSRDKRHLEALYDGEITYHDRQFGKFIKNLKKEGVLDDTIFVICADHGEEFFEHESVGHGHTVFQELLHVPLFVRAPGLFPKGAKVTANVSLSDIVPTILEATGDKKLTEFEGRSLIYAGNNHHQHPFNTAFSSFFSEADDRNLQWAARMGDWKLRMRGPVNTYVYNLSDDPKEQIDVDEKYPVARRALRISLGQFIGAPDKSQWMSSRIKADVVGKPESEEEKNENIPDDLKQQLQQLGYMK